MMEGLQIKHEPLWIQFDFQIRELWKKSETIKLKENEKDDVHL